MEPRTSAERPSGTSKGTRPVFRFVRDHGERAEAINELFNRFTGRQRSMAAYHWEWLEGVPGPGFRWVILEPDTERVVGHHGIVQTPIVSRGRAIAGGRTENTIIYPEVRKKLFYPGMEKKAFTEVLRTLSLLYTVHASGAQGKIRERLGYQPVGRWRVYLPVVRAGYLEPLLRRARERLAPWAPAAATSVAARLAGGLLGLGRLWRSAPTDVTCSEAGDAETLRAEYEILWQEARGSYDATIDRSWAFLSWRIFHNPNLRFRTWLLRRDEKLIGIVIGHVHRLGTASALYVDDIICRDYGDRDFDAAVRWLPFLMRDADAVVVMTLDVDTPLRRALDRRHRAQALLLERLAARLFDEVVIYDRDSQCAGDKWYVTPIFTEGLDTSR